MQPPKEMTKLITNSLMVAFSQLCSPLSIHEWMCIYTHVQFTFRRESPNGPSGFPASLGVPFYCLQNQKHLQSCLPLTDAQMHFHKKLEKPATGEHRLKGRTRAWTKIKNPMSELASFATVFVIIFCFSACMMWFGGVGLLTDG